LLAQTLPPTSILVVARPDDLATLDVVGSFREVQLVLVGEAGVLPPLRVGREALPAEAEVVIITDDDASARPDAIERLFRHYDAPEVGAVGGRIREHVCGRPAPARRLDYAGRVTRTGRFLGGFEAEPVSPLPRDVEFLRGAWMSFRRAVFDRLELHMALNGDAGIHYEVDLGLQVRELGYRIVYEPTSVVRHDNAPRMHGSARGADDPKRAQAQAHNTTYVQLLHLRGARRPLALAHNLVVGDSSNWGLVKALIDPLLHRRVRWRGQLLAAYRGKFQAARRYWSERHV